MFRVAVPVPSGGQFTTVMREMREWLDRNRAEAIFECSFAPGKTACYLEFRSIAQAKAFATAFLGDLEGRGATDQMAA